MKNFRTLNLAIEFNHSVQNYKIAGQLRDQLLRASSSIALNLAEGNAKSSIKEKRRYYQIAYGSLKECQVIFKLVQNQEIEIEQKADHLGASLYKLMQSNLSGIDIKN